MGAQCLGAPRNSPEIPRRVAHSKGKPFVCIHEIKMYHARASFDFIWFCFPRFTSPRYWAAFCILGGDPYINLLEVKRDMLDQLLNSTESSYLNSQKTDVLNIRKESSQGKGIICIVVIFGLQVRPKQN